MSPSKDNGILLESGTNELEIIEFHVHRLLPNGQVKVCYYGINVAKVREVIRVPETSDYPKAHDNLVGVFSLRDKLIPMVDLGSWLGIPTKDDLEEKVVIVTDFNKMINGFLVDHVQRIHRVSWEQVESPSQFLEAGSQDCVVAVVRNEGHIIMILDFEKIIADINPELSMDKYDLTHDKLVPMTPEILAQRDAKTIMVVDDSAFIRKMIEATLIAGGYTVITAKDGAEALDKLVGFERQVEEHGGKIEDHINGIVSDVEMPQMDGLHLVKRLRDSSSYKSIPIVMFSSLMSDSNRAKALQLGANDTITKPEIERMIPLMDRLVLGLDHEAELLEDAS